MTIEEASKQRQLIEMQRQVEVDTAEEELVKHGVIGGYEVPPGIDVPVLHPPPAQYNERDLPASIMGRHDPDKILSDATKAQISAHTPRRPGSVDDRLKGEAASAQLIRETVLLGLKKK